MVNIVKEGTVVILGGGWCGVRLALRDPGKYLLTSRSASKAAAAPVRCVRFDLCERETWKHLPRADVVAGVVVTFELTSDMGHKLKELLATWLCEHKDTPIVLLSTSSVYKAPDFAGAVTESSPKTGLGVMGKPLTDRVAAEESMLDSEWSVCVLHLAGLCSDEDDAALGGSRAVRKFIESPYISRQSFPVMNLVHINDVLNVIEKALHGEHAALDLRWMGERFLVSGGAYGWGDLAAGLGVADPVWDSVPSEEIDAPKSQRIVSAAKLMQMLGKDYTFKSPVPGVEAKPYSSTCRVSMDSGLRIEWSNACGVVVSMVGGA